MHQVHLEDRVVGRPVIGEFDYRADMWQLRFRLVSQFPEDTGDVGRALGTYRKHVFTLRAAPTVRQGRRSLAGRYVRASCDRITSCAARARTASTQAAIS